MYRVTSALAFAALMTAPAAQAVDWQLDDKTSFSVYGSLEPKLISETNSNGDDSFELDDEDSTLGFYAEHQFAQELSGFGQIEVEFSSDDDDSATGGAFDEQDSAFAGIKGDFGKLQAGNFDNAYEDLIIDATEVAEDAEISDEAVASEDNMIAYYSPAFGGFSFRTQVRIQGEDELAGVNNPDNEVGFAAAGGYTAERFGLYVGYDDLGSEVVTQFDSNGNVTGQDTADGSTAGVAATTNFGPVELAAKYALQDNEDNDPVGDETEFLAGRTTIDYGPGDIYGAVQEVSPDEAADRTELTIGADYNVFSNLKLWSEAGRFDRTNDDGDNVMVGAIYSF